MDAIETKNKTTVKQREELDEITAWWIEEYNLDPVSFRLFVDLAIYHGELVGVKKAREIMK